MEDNRMVSFSLGGMAFEYDDNKNQINIKKHGISFKSAARIHSLTMTESSFMMRIIAMTKIDITP